MENFNKREESKGIIFLRTLERELVCLAIRHCIYPTESKSYYNRKVIEKKRKIKDVGRFEDVTSVLTDYRWAYKVVCDVFPEKSTYPSFIYNHHIFSNNKITPKNYIYTGSAVKAVSNGETYTGVCKHISIEEENVSLRVYRDEDKGEEGNYLEMAFPLGNCSRLDYVDSDKFFWGLHTINNSHDDIRSTVHEIITNGGIQEGRD